MDRPVIPLLLLALQGVPAPSIDSHGSAELPAIQETARPATIDWDMLAPLTYLEPPTLTPPMRRFVDGEVRSGRCRPPRDAAGRYTITLDVAVPVAGDGRILRPLPRAIDCPPAEPVGPGLERTSEVEGK